jgi:hypothetical protein
MASNPEKNIILNGFQGDQIEPILGIFNAEVALIVFLATVLIFTNNVSDYVLADFFTNSSGHPDSFIELKYLIKKYLCRMLPTYMYA